MKVEFESRGDVSVVTITGSIDSLTAEALLSQLHTHVADGHVYLVADFGGVDYTSSAGLRVLLSTVKETRRGGGDLRLATVNQRVFKVLELSGFTTIIKFYDGVDVAIASYAAPAAV